VIVLDTTAVVALQDRRDSRYQAALDAIRDEPGPFVVPLAILAEVDAVLAGRTQGAMQHVLASVTDGSLLVDAADEDLGRMAELVGPATGGQGLAVADAAVIACAERNGGRVLTFVPGPYLPFARQGVLTLVPSVGT
jgi:predicted nucleic acid-binding protein